MNTALIGAAGVHFVASELSIRGLIALPTTRNTAGFDVVVVSEDGSEHALLQVKTSKGKAAFWPVGERYLDWAGKNHYYVFVRYLKREERFEAFLEPARRVAKQVSENVQKERERGRKAWAPCWFLPKDELERNRVVRQWLDFGKGPLNDL